MTYLQLKLGSDPYYEAKAVSFRGLCFPEQEFAEVQDQFLDYLLYLSSDNDVRAAARISFSANRALIQYLAVDPDCRRSGMACQFLRECERRFGSFQVELLYEQREMFKSLDLSYDGKYYISDGLKLVRLGCSHSFCFFASDKSRQKDEKAIRFAVFVDEQQFSTEEEIDEFEDESVHCVMYRNDCAVACCRLRQFGDEAKLERFAVALQHRNSGYGKRMMLAVNEFVAGKRKAEDEAAQCIAGTLSGKPLVLHSQMHCVYFYEKQGFVKRGDEFVECGARHYKMSLPK